MELRDLPIRLHWRGWAADSHRLRHEGWKLSCDETFCDFSFTKRLRVVAQSPLNDFMLMGELYLNMDTGRHLAKLAESLCSRGVTMQIYRVFDCIQVYAESKSTWDSMQRLTEWDGFASVPVLPDSGAYRHQISELQIFKQARGSDIYLPEASVDECLNQILKMQYPKAKVLESLAAEKGKHVSRPSIKAQIFSLAC